MKNVAITDDLHRQLKTTAVEIGVPLQSLVASAAMSWLRQYAKEKAAPPSRGPNPILDEMPEAGR